MGTVTITAELEHAEQQVRNDPAFAAAVRQVVEAVHYAVPRDPPGPGRAYWIHGQVGRMEFILAAAYVRLVACAAADQAPPARST